MSQQLVKRVLNVPNKIISFDAIHDMTAEKPHHPNITSSSKLKYGCLAKSKLKSQPSHNSPKNPTNIPRHRLKIT